MVAGAGCKLIRPKAPLFDMRRGVITFTARTPAEHCTANRESWPHVGPQAERGPEGVT